MLHKATAVHAPAAGRRRLRMPMRLDRHARARNPDELIDRAAMGARLPHVAPSVGTATTGGRPTARAGRRLSARRLQQAPDAPNDRADAAAHRATPVRPEKRSNAPDRSFRPK